jgi:hypothetical protein
VLFDPSNAGAIQSNAKMNGFQDIKKRAITLTIAGFVRGDSKM